MKKVIILTLVAALVVACGGSKSEKETAAPELTTAQLVSIGKTLVDNSDCKTCHHPTNRIIGPSHTEVAQKYEFNDENIKMLATRIIQGGSGVWGEIAMTPHPDLSQDDAEKMAIYVLSLDGEERKK
jgi:cytochrome c